MSVITLAIPSKGRLMEATAELLAKAGFSIDRLGADRGYRGMLRGLDGVEIYEPEQKIQFKGNVPLPHALRVTGPIRWSKPVMISDGAVLIWPA